MAIPDFESIMLPLLKFLNDGKRHSVSEAEEHLSSLFNLSLEERTQKKSSGGETLFHNRLHWAKFYLKKAGLIENPPRLRFKITTRGTKTLGEKLDKIDTTYLMQFQEFLDFIGKKK